MFESGALRPVIDSRFALADIADAHRHMEANANVGKILIDLSASPKSARSTHVRALDGEHHRHEEPP